MALEPEKMKSVNVVMTRAMIEAIDRVDPSNRSRVVRHVLAAILAAHADGQPNPFRSAIDHALRSSAKNRRSWSGYGLTWEKSIIWIPERMHNRLDRLLDPVGMRVADFIRGSMIGYTRIDPMADLEVRLRGSESHAGDL